MATMLGSCTNSVKVVFKTLPSLPHLDTDPLAQHVPFEELYLQRMRELDLAHSLLYHLNAIYIENLKSRLQAATELVAKTIILVLGDNESAQQAAAAFRSCRMLETAEDVSRRTVQHPEVIYVCKEDPAMHKDLPKFVWETPELDEAFIDVAAQYGWTTIADYENILLYKHIHDMFVPAIAAQQQVIHSLVDALSEQTIITQLHQVLKVFRVPKKTITLICARVVALQCHWTTEIPAYWLSEPVKTRSSGQQPSCVVVEEPDSSNNNTNTNNKTNNNNNTSNKTNNNNNTSNKNKNNNNNNSNNHNSKGWRLFSVRLGKAVAAAGVTVASMLANRHGA